ncbi:MAG: hypothetical protein O7E51_06325 [Acidobacteria bacterium]|nr:hypothetical protein [Acidobacteriota bacterium]
MEKTNLHGVNVSLGTNLNRNLAIVTDFSGNFGSSNERVFGLSSDVDFRSLSFTVGPRAGERFNDRWHVFVHALLGATRLRLKGTLEGPVSTQSFSESTTGFAGFIGGGIDLKISESASIRLLQVDYLIFRGRGDLGTGAKTEGARLSFGLVMNIGTKQ